MSGAGAWPNDNLGGVVMVVPSVGLTKVWKFLASCFMAVVWLLFIGGVGDAGCRMWMLSGMY